MSALGYIQESHNYRWSGDDYVHFECKSCGEGIKNSGRYHVRSNTISCFQPNCDFHEWVPATVYVKAFTEWDSITLAKNLKLFKVSKSKQRLKTLNDKTNPFLPEHCIPLTEGKGSLTNKLDAYIQSRGFTREYLYDRYRLLYVKKSTFDWKTSYMGRIVFPYYNEYGNLEYFQSRTFLKDKLRWKNPSVKLFGIGKNQLIYNKFNLYGKYDNLFINEGIFDVYESEKIEGTRATHVGGSNLSFTQGQFFGNAPAKDVFIALDGGTVATAMKFAKALLANRSHVWLIDLPIKEFSSYDCSEIGFEELQTYISKAHKITNRNFLLMENRIKEIVNVDPKTQKKHKFHVMTNKTKIYL